MTTSINLTLEENNVDVFKEISNLDPEGYCVDPEGYCVDQTVSEADSSSQCESNDNSLIRKNIHVQIFILFEIYLLAIGIYQLYVGHRHKNGSDKLSFVTNNNSTLTECFDRVHDNMTSYGATNICASILSIFGTICFVGNITNERCPLKPLYKCGRCSFHNFNNIDFYAGICLVMVGAVMHLQIGVFIITYNFLTKGACRNFLRVSENQLLIAMDIESISTLIYLVILICLFCSVKRLYQ